MEVSSCKMILIKDQVTNGSINKQYTLDDIFQVGDIYVCYNFLK